MKNPLLMAAAVAAAALTVACCPCRSYQKKTRRPLVETRWQLLKIGGTTVEPQEGTFELVLQPDGRLVGFGACNRLTGRYAADATRALRFDSLAATRTACPDLQREQDFLRALATTTHYDMDGPMLLLLSNGRLNAVFQAQP